MAAAQNVMQNVVSFQRREHRLHVDSMGRYLRQGHPEKCIGVLMKMPKPKEEMLNVITRECENEMRAYCDVSAKSMLRRNFNLSNVQSYDRETVVAQARTHMPFLCAALDGAVVKSDEQRLEGSVIAQMAYSANRAMKFDAQLMSVILWNGKLNSEVSLCYINSLVRCLNYLTWFSEKVCVKTFAARRVHIRSGVL